MAQHESELTSSFFEICVKQIPSFERVRRAAIGEVFVPLSEGDIPELDPHIFTEDVKEAFFKVLSGNSIFALAAVAEVRIEGRATTACSIQIFPAEPDLIADTTSALLRMNAPTFDVVNSGERLRGWNVFVEGKRTVLALQNISRNGESYGAKLTIGSETK